MTVKDLLKAMTGKQAKTCGSSASAAAPTAAGGGPACAASGGCAFSGCAAEASTQCSRCPRVSYCGEVHEGQFWLMRYSVECVEPAKKASDTPDPVAARAWA